MADAHITFKEMCTEFDVTPRTLRYYEYIELLSPRREGRSRLYGRREVARMKLIMRGRRFGFSLEEIRQWLQLYEDEGSFAQYQDFIQRADRQLENLRAEFNELTDKIKDLQTLRDDTASLLEEKKKAV